MTREEYTGQLNQERRKQPLKDTCAALKLHVAVSANLERLRMALISYWTGVYPAAVDEATLVEHYGLDAGARELLGFGDDDDEDDEEAETFDAFQTRVRLDAVKRTKGNRREGGLKTQQASVWLWNEWVALAKAQGTIHDEIVDEHSLLLFIQYSAERCKRTRRGVDIPNTFVGASQLKKLFFAVLRIRKEQDAADISLARRRPATSVVVWDEIKTRMDIALKRAHSGLVPGEDAPDIVTNTFLEDVSEEQMAAVGDGFIQHRELRSCVYGHVAWVTQIASGNRGDDLRALKLAELQPWVMLHPNGQTAIECILGLQSEEKAGMRGMRTIINPVYTVWIAHRDPVRCPLGAFALLMHFLHDVKDFTTHMEVNWSVNKSWRRARVLSGPGAFDTPFSDQSLYNLYVKAFDKADFVSRVKAHLPRHILGYKQEQMGVDPGDTAQLGWVRGETYFDTYRPAIPKVAVLGAHGYKKHEIYDPVWRHVHVPEQFLSLVCPMAEEIHSQIVGKANLTGAANYWSMVIKLRPILFQCGAALYERQPNSALFRLPALANTDVRNWMSSTFRTELTLLRAKEGSPVDLQRLENELLQQSLESIRSLAAQQASEIKALRVMFERRTSVLSPTQGFSADSYHQSSKRLGPTLSPTHSSTVIPQAPAVYLTPDSTLRAHVNESPKSPGVTRSRTQVDLVLPSIAAFSKEGATQFIWPPLLGQKSINWHDVFPLIKQPNLCWAVWKPSKTLDRYESVKDVYDCYALGEAVYMDGVQTGVKPPLRLVEQYFQYHWRKVGKTSKSWQRFREIPEYIDSQSRLRRVSPDVIINELEQMREDGKSKKGLNALMLKLVEIRKTSLSTQTSNEPSPIPDEDAARSTGALQTLPHRVTTPPPLPATSPLRSPFTESHPFQRKRRAPAIKARTQTKRQRDV
ncbi:hypothetical protein PLEOSDRAFT_1079281 [Pleurotus ostreatus PC15]|uniref:Ndc10 domain-containing protein n=1 Tax=Pleurotus ostreatus (strain PC15) TaxID=1137138 RepID=A0A067NAY8_PLEO1|nr:hypothetical protein PLEOSDRAFT_1079281 [Pleurotus ostreatus PC15]